jgi:hypothetical protein
MALTANRNTQQRGSDGSKVVMPLADDVIIYIGAIVTVDTSGYAHPGRASATDVALGCASLAYPNWKSPQPGLQGQGFPGRPADNTRLFHSAGAVAVEIQNGTFNYDNDGSITSANVGQLCFVVDDHTVSLTDGSGTQCVAGRIVFVDPDNTVWVDFRDRSVLAS